MDPVTAINNCVTAFFSFLATPAGQKFALDLLSASEAFSVKLSDLLDHLHGQVTPAAPKASS
jgi:hypothetical protein